VIYIHLSSASLASIENMLYCYNFGATKSNKSYETAAGTTVLLRCT